MTRVLRTWCSSLQGRSRDWVHQRCIDNGAEIITPRVWYCGRHDVPRTNLPQSCLLAFLDKVLDLMKGHLVNIPSLVLSDGFDGIEVTWRVSAKTFANGTIIAHLVC